jgi:hypothetical protein
MDSPFLEKPKLLENEFGFVVYDGDQIALEGAKSLGKINAIKNVIPKQGSNFWVNDMPVHKPKINHLRKRKVNVGDW